MSMKTKQSSSAMFTTRNCHGDTSGSAFAASDEYPGLFLSIDKQVTSICKSAFYHLHNIAKIRKFISFKNCETLFQAFVTSKLDYCNSLLSRGGEW